MKSVLRMTVLLLFFICIDVAFSIVMTSTKRPKSQIFLAVDDQVVEFKINGNKMALPTNFNYNDWSSTKKFEFTLYRGDWITVTGRNLGSNTNMNQNPAGILATIVYVNKKGKEKRFHTGPLWKCDGKTPLLQALNKDKNSPWSRGGKGMTDIHPEAQWIWGTSKAATATCTFRIPCGKY